MSRSAWPPSQVASGEPRWLTLSYQSLQVIAAGVDFCLLVLASWLGFAIYNSYLTREFIPVSDGIGTGVVAAAFFIVLSSARGLYSIQSLMAPALYLKNVLIILAAAILILICNLFLLKVGTQYSRGSVFSFAVLAFLFIPLGRVSFAHLSAVGAREGMISGRRAVVLGEAAELERLAAPDLRRFGIEEIARVRVIKNGERKGLSVSARARISGAIGLARQLKATEFVLLVPWSQERMLAEIGELLRSSPLSVKLLPDRTLRTIVSWRKVGDSNPNLTIELQREPLRRWERLAKRAIDLTLSLSAAVLLSPLFLFVALAIKLDSKGPVLFRQRRCGFDAREFVIFKFRTMKVLEDGDNVVQARRNDWRVTRIGRLLRRSSVDELPQLLNVIRGDMSLVGPRPHAIAHHNQYGAVIASYALRHHVKPGITGIAQINGLRGETLELVQMERRVDKDLWYIGHWSLTLDLMILLRTCFIFLRQEVY